MNFYQEPTLKEFNQLNKQIDQLYHKIAVKQNLSDSAFLILYSILELGDTCTQKDICDFIFLNKQTVNSSIQKLQKEGYIRLQSGAGREMQIFLTENGENLMKDKILPIVEAENKVFQEMLPTERSMLINLTEKYFLLFREQLHKIFKLSSEDL